MSAIRKVMPLFDCSHLDQFPQFMLTKISKSLFPYLSIYWFILPVSFKFSL